ncbi:MAG: OB-fold domain-containing protein [Pseudomonadota bacterium]|nr:OB-fold domain-containing protein [Pseudomonadota bacterium]
MMKLEKHSRPAPTPTNITQEFWNAIKEHNFLLQFDRDSKKYQFYPRALSVHSGKQNLEWREASGQGTVYSYTETHIPARGFEGLEPYLIVTVELDEGVRLMSLLYNCSVEQVKIGMKVRICWDKINEEFDYFAFEPEP